MRSAAVNAYPDDEYIQDCALRLFVLVEPVVASVPVLLEAMQRAEVVRVRAALWAAKTVAENSLPPGDVAELVRGVRRVVAGPHRADQKVGERAAKALCVFYPAIVYDEMFPPACPHCCGVGAVFLIFLP